MKVPDWFIWVGMTLAAIGFVFVIAASNAHAETGKIDVEWVTNDTCIISGVGLVQAVVQEDCDDDFSFDVERIAVNHSVLEPFNCNYSILESYLANSSALNFSDYVNLTCNESAGLDRQNIIETEMKAFIDDHVVKRLDTLSKLQDDNKNLTTELTLWKTNATGSWAAIASYERENIRLSEDRTVWQYASFFLFVMLVFFSPLGDAARRRFFGRK